MPRTIKVSKKDTSITISPEERDISDIIKVLQANIKHYPGYGMWKPSVCLTKGQMAYMVEILGQYQGSIKESDVHA